MGTIESVHQDKTIEITKNNIQKLSVLLGRDSFFYALFGSDQKKITYNRWVKTDKNSTFSDWVLHKLTEDRSLISAQPEAIHLGIFSNNFTLVPVPLYEEEHKRLFLARNMHFSESMQCHVDSIVTRDYIKLLYAVPRYVKKIQHYFGRQVKLNHIITPLLHAYYRQYAEHREQCLFIHARNEVQIIILFDQGKLKFSNVYRYQSDNDFFYYLSLVLSKFNVNPHAVEVFMSGEIFQRTSKYKWLKKHLNHLQFVKLPVSENGNLIRSGVPDHEIYDLMVQSMYSS